MSSILDALNKLEREKQLQQAAPSPEEGPVTPEEAVAEMFGKPSRLNKPSFKSYHPWAPMAGALLLGIAITSATVIFVLWFVSGPAQTAAVIPVAKAETEPLRTYSVPVRMDDDYVMPDKDAPALTGPEPATTAPTLPKENKENDREAPPTAPHRDEAKRDVTVSEPEPPLPVIKERAVAQPVSKVPEPEYLPAVRGGEDVVSPGTPEAVLPEQADVSEEKAAVAQDPPDDTGERLVLAQSVKPSLPETALPVATPPAARSVVGTVNVNKLPRLSVQEQEELNLDSLRLNVLRPADKTQPDALAIINLKKVYVGEMIPGTPARLIAVDAGAIGIEIDTGGAQKRFRIPR